MEFSKEEKKKIMNMSPEEWQQYKIAHKEYEQISDYYNELTLKLEAEKQEYLKESQKQDREVADYFKEKNLAEFEKTQNEIILQEKKEYLKRLELEAAKNQNKKFDKKRIIYIIAAVAVVLLIIILIIALPKRDDSKFTEEEIAQLEMEYANNNNAGYKDPNTGKYFLNRESEADKKQDMELEAASKAKLFYSNNEVGLLCYSRNINNSLFVQKQTVDRLIALVPNEFDYYSIYLNPNNDSSMRTINYVFIDYDNLRYNKNNDVYLMYEDFVINRNTTYSDMKNYFNQRADSIIESTDSKKHMEIVIDKYRIVIESYEEAQIKPVGTVDKLTIYVNN